MKIQNLIEFLEFLKNVMLYSIVGIKIKNNGFLILSNNFVYNII